MIKLQYIYIDGNCELYSINDGSSYRVQFLGGYEVSDDKQKEEMCYKYKLHQHEHKKHLIRSVNNNNNNDITIWSMKICDSDSKNNNNDNSASFGVLSDYLTQVSLFNNNKKDNYYIDDTHFYYVSYNSSNNEPIIELCFSPRNTNDNNNNINSNNNIIYNNDAKVVTETEYCIQHSQNGKKLCSRRGVFVTDICGLDSVARSNSNSNQVPPTPIDYIPIPGKSYKLNTYIQTVIFFLRKV